MCRREVREFTQTHFLLNTTRAAYHCEPERGDSRAYGMRIII
jgi:hypothetical protein